jgi:hypothetical protein
MLLFILWNHEMIDPYILPINFKIVAGGQTGADQAGLDWAIAHGILHGGWCPKGRRSEDGPIDLRYELNETPRAHYLERTEWNVRDSDATLIFTLDSGLDGGSKKTVEFCKKLGKPWLHFRTGVDPKFVGKFLKHYDVKILNIAGKRESSAPGIGKMVMEVLNEVLEVSAKS